MQKNRRANATLFGFDFQRNAAIVLMLDNIKELRSVRLEGNEEDIEISLTDGQKILAQAKAVEKKQHGFFSCPREFKEGAAIPFGRCRKGICTTTDFDYKFHESV